jgi:glycosyltransferase involved in cell wall biosynthesis
MRHSLIIPAYNEGALLPGLLDTVDAARARYPFGADAIEVIVADNASTDDTAPIAAARGCRVVRVEKRVIAAARNGGAAIARGAALSFVDADSRIHPDTFDAVDRALADSRIVGGATGVRPDRWSPGIVVAYLMFQPVVLLTGMDTGVVFCRREDFEQVGGYDERRVVAEDVAFLVSLIRLGRRRGQKLTRVHGVKTITSMRKFDRFGDWHLFTHMIRLAFVMLRRPEARDEFALRYWYKDRD